MPIQEDALARDGLVTEWPPELEPRQKRHCIFRASGVRRVPDAAERIYQRPVEIAGFEGVATLYPGRVTHGSLVST